MAEISDSRLFLTCGMPFEAKIQNKIASQNPNIVFVDTSKGVALQTSKCSHDATNDHDHEHGEKDPHIWLDPRNAIVMAENIRAALAPIDPDGRAACSTRTEALVERLTSLHKVLSERLAAYRGSSFYIYHPAFGYFAEAYGLKQVSVETEGKEPSARQLAELVDNAKRARIRVVFAQSQFSTRTAEMLARAIDGKVVILDDLAPDLITNLDAISTKFLEALAQGKAQ
jgi:zinc transport system substrate-binding protein